jgi:aspartate kinase
VVKFGGSVLRDGEGIRKAAHQVKAEVDKGNKVVVVVSALKGVTDQLLDATEAIDPNTPTSVKDHIIRLGEEQSTRLVSSALSLIGVESEEFTVDSPSWPIITDDNFGDAEPVIALCQQAVNLGLKPVIARGVTPVVSGFVGRSTSGEVTTLGRGGTDTTATVLARCLNADELVLVKDVGGVYSADPNQVESAEKLDVISTSDAYQLSSSGAKVVHDKVFKHKNPELGIRLISTGEDLAGSGTLIVGDLTEYDLEILDTPVHEFTLIGEGDINGNTVSNAVIRVAREGGVVKNLEANGSSFSILASGESASILNGLHELVKGTSLRAVSHKEGLHQVTLRGVDLDRLKQGASKISELPTVHKVCLSKTHVTLTLASRGNLEKVLKSIGLITLAHG